MKYSIDIMKYGQQLLDLSQVRMDICNKCIFLDYDYSKKEYICLILHDVYNGFGKNNRCDEKSGVSENTAATIRSHLKFEEI